MANADAVKAMTINGTGLIDMSDEPRPIEVNKFTDICAVSGNPLVEIKISKTSFL